MCSNVKRIFDMAREFSAMSESPCWALLIATLIEISLSDNVSELKAKIQYEDYSSEFGLPRTRRSKIVITLGDQNLSAETSQFDPEWLVSLIARGVEVVHEGCTTHAMLMEQVFRNALSILDIDWAWHAVPSAGRLPCTRSV